MTGPLRSLLALKRQAQAFGAPSVRSFAAETLPQFKSSVVRDPATGLLAPQWHYGSFGVEPGNSKPRPGMHFGTRKAAQERDIGAPFEYLDRELTREVADEFGWDWKDPRTGQEVQRRMDAIMESDPAAALEGYRPDPGTVKTSPYLLDIRKPLIVEDAGGDNDKWNYLLRFAREQDRDGLLYKNKVEDKGSNSWVTLGDRPQVKSLRARTLDMGDADVYKAGGGLVRGLKAARKGLAAADPEALTPAARLKDADEQLRLLPEVIKKPGGNWLTGSVERAVEPLRSKGFTRAEAIDNRSRRLQAMGLLERYGPGNDAYGDPLSDEALVREMTSASLPPSAQPRLLSEEEAALNRWIDKKLTPYIKNDMATERDPIRALAERGVTHAGIPPSELLRADRHRELSGDAAGRLGGFHEARNWEDAADLSVDVRTPRDYGVETFKERSGEGERWINPDTGEVLQHPWMKNLPADAPIHEIRPAYAIGLGFDHIVDVLREQLTTGALTPQQLDKVNIANAVERTHAYNLEREAARKAALAANLESMTPYKAYDEGWRWVQLDKPGQFAAESDAMGHSVRGYEPPRGHKDWVAGSGNSGSPGYGLGGWDAITSGRAKVYSLKDKDGKTYATVEAASPTFGAWYTGLSPAQQNEISEKIFSGGHVDNAKYNALLKNAYEKELSSGSVPLEVRQLKGPSNGRPDPAALPYIQDFVRSGNWSEVRDLQNAGMRKLGDKYYGEDDLKKIYTDALKNAPENGAKGYLPFEQLNWEYYPERARALREAGLQDPSPIDSAIIRALGFEP